MAGTAVSSVSLIKVYLLFCLLPLERASVCWGVAPSSSMRGTSQKSSTLQLTSFWQCTVSTLLPNAHILILLTDPHIRWWIPCPPPSIFASCRDSHAALLSTPLSSCCAIAAMSAPSWRRRPPLLQPLLRSSLCPACAEFRNRGVDFTFKAFDFERLARGQDWEGWGGLTWSEAPWGTEGATKQVLVKNMEAKADFTRVATTLPYVFFISW